MSDPRIILTGVTGFIGSRVAARLGSRRPLCLVRSERARAAVESDGFEAILCDLEADNLSLILRCGDIVVHTGGPGLSDITSGAEGAHEKISNLVRGAERSGVGKFVYLSTIKARDPTDRQGALRATDIYGEMKREEERILSASALSWTIVRASAVFGFPDRKSFPLFAALRGRVVPLLPEKWSGRFDLVHVDQVAETLIAATDPAFDYGVFEIGATPSVTWNDLVRLLAVRSVWRPILPVRLIKPAVSLGARFLPAMRLVRDRIRDLTEFNWIVDPERRPDRSMCQPVPLERALKQTMDEYDRHGW